MPYIEEPMTSWELSALTEKIYGKNNNKLTFAQGVDPENYADKWNWKFEPATESTSPVLTLKDGFDVTLNNSSSELKFPSNIIVNYSGNCELKECFMRFVNGDVTFRGADADSRLDVSGSDVYVMCSTDASDVINLIIDGNGTVSFTALNEWGSAIGNITTLSVKDNATVISSCQKLNPINGGEVVSGYYTKKNAEVVINEVTYKQSIIKANADLGEHLFDDDGFCTVDNCLLGLNGDSEYLPAEYDATEDVYKISKPGQLFWFAEKLNNAYAANPGNVEGISLNAVLMNDIVIPAGRQWEPIDAYNGIFDGDGHTISRMNVEIPGGTAGMFLQNAGTIKHLGIIDSSFATVGKIQGQSPTTGMLGAVAGFSCGTIEDCYSRNITFRESDTSVGSVCVGGIVGHITKTVSTPLVKNCYSAGLTFSDIEADNMDSNGIVGLAMGTYTIENCYYEANENFNKTFDGATSKTAAEFSSGEIAAALNGTRTGDDAVWGQKLGESGDAYPVFGGDAIYSYKVYENCAADSTFETVYTNDASLSGTVVQDEHDFTDNNGFCNGCGCYEPAVLNNGVYEISNVGQLYWFADKVNNDYTNFKAANAKLVKDIVVNDITVDENNGSCSGIGTRPEWIPIGQSDTKKYMGTFDGNNKTISGLYYRDDDGSYYTIYSFINYLGETGVIKDFGLVNTYFLGRYSAKYIAGICAFNDGHIENSYFNGFTGGHLTEECCNGGVCAVNNGTITKCYKATRLTTGSYAGGICGHNKTDGIIKDCYNTGIILAGGMDAGEITRYAGGICGYNEGEISYCYNNNALAGATYSGGICGSNSGTIENCYSNYEPGIGNGTQSDSVIKKTTEFASGEVTVLLNNGRTGSAAVWGQKLTGDNKDAYPVFSSDYVYSGYKHGESTATYTNDGTLKLHSDAASEENNNHDSSLDANSIRIAGDDCHAYTCSVCGEEFEKAHDFGDGQYKATSDGAIHYIQCQDCGYRRVHSADMIYTQNSKYHVGACEHEGCNYTVDKEAHEFTRFFKGDAEKHIAVCEECGFVTAKEHNFVNGVCKDCSYEKPLEDTVNITNVTFTVASGKNRVVFEVERDVPVKYTMLEYGIIYSGNGAVTDVESADSLLVKNNVDGTDIKIMKSTNSVNSGKTTIRLIDSGSGVIARPYVLVRNADGQEVYGYGAVAQGNYKELAEKAIKDATRVSIIKVQNDVVVNSKNRVAFSVMRDVKEGYTVIERGIVYSSDGQISSLEQAEEKLYIGNSGVKVMRSASVVPNYGILKVNLTELGNGVYAKGYVVVKDSYGNTATVYSEADYGKNTLESNN